MELFTPIEYLKIDIASNFGLDKENWDVRLDWFNQNEDEISALASISTFDMAADKRVAAHPLMKKADKPAQFYAGVTAWDKARSGEAIGYPISLDATASGK